MYDFIKYAPDAIFEHACNIAEKLSDDDPIVGLFIIIYVIVVLSISFITHLIWCIFSVPYFVFLALYFVFSALHFVFVFICNHVKGLQKRRQEQRQQREQQEQQEQRELMINQRRELILIQEEINLAMRMHREREQERQRIEQEHILNQQTLQRIDIIEETLESIQNLFQEDNDVYNNFHEYQIQKENDYVSIQIDNINAPDEFLCPISLEIMHNPYIAIDGYTYEYSNILKWILEHHNSPYTRELLTLESLIPNYSLKNLIEKYLSDNNYLKTTPEEFICPLTKNIMEKPCITSDGFTYKKQALFEHKYNGIMIQNRVIKNLITNFAQFEINI
jgi:hypothetical protein